MVILKLLVICWTNLKDQNESKTREELTRVSNLFVKVVEGVDKDGINGQLETLVKADPTLKDLFSM